MRREAVGKGNWIGTKKNAGKQETGNASPAGLTPPSCEKAWVTDTTYLPQGGSQDGIAPGRHAIPEGIISGAGQPVRGSGPTGPLLNPCTRGDAQVWPGREQVQGRASGVFGDFNRFDTDSYVFVPRGSRKPVAVFARGQLVGSDTVNLPLACLIRIGQPQTIG